MIGSRRIPSQKQLVDTQVAGSHPAQENSDRPKAKVAAAMAAVAMNENSRAEEFDLLEGD
jgi:hypothetical protein